MVEGEKVSTCTMPIQYSEAFEILMLLSDLLFYNFRKSLRDPPN